MEFNFSCPLIPYSKNDIRDRKGNIRTGMTGDFYTDEILKEFKLWLQRKMEAKFPDPVVRSREYKLLWWQQGCLIFIISKLKKTLFIDGAPCHGVPPAMDLLKSIFNKNIIYGKSEFPTQPPDSPDLSINDNSIWNRMHCKCQINLSTSISERTGLQHFYVLQHF